MQVVPLAGWGTLAVFSATETPQPGAPWFPDWLPSGGAYRPARLTVRRWPGRTLDYIAVWPDGAVVRDADSGLPWHDEQLDGVVLAEPTEHFRCAVCRRQVNALYPEVGLPMLDRFDRHRMARRCPHCGAHVDTARLHALALFVPTPDRG